MNRVPLVAGIVLVAFILAGGSYVAYSQISDSDRDNVKEAFDAATTPRFQPVVARVNGQQITSDRIALIVALNEQQPPDGASGLDDTGQTSSPRDVLDSIIDLELAYQEAQRRGLVCTDAEVRDLAVLQTERVRQAGGGDYLALKANYLGINVNELTTDPKALEPYVRACARGKLSDQLAPAEAKNDPSKMMEFWRDLKASLRQGAQIEILDPTLQ